jgi:hypothetical protein
MRGTDPDETLSLADMIAALRDGQPVDHDLMAEQLAKRAAELGVPWKVIGETRMRAQQDRHSDS